MNSLLNQDQQDSVNCFWDTTFNNAQNPIICNFIPANGASVKFGPIKGTNNGTWGVGMFGGYFPRSMNGPIGYVNFPLPNNVGYQTSYADNDIKYSARDYNGPYYNESSFHSIMGSEIPKNVVYSVDKLDPFNFRT